MANRIYRGIVRKVVLAGSDNFFILKMDLEDEGEVTVAGSVFGVSVVRGMSLAFEGVPDTHPKYGPQIRIVRAPLTLAEWSSGDVIEFLRAYGAGDLLLKKVRDFARDNPNQSLSEVLEKEELSREKLGEDGPQLHRMWKVLSATIQGHQFLHGMGLTVPQIQEVWRRLGEKTVEVVTEDPWVLYEAGVPFGVVDEITTKTKTKASPTSPKRIAASMAAVVGRGATEGHLFLPASYVLGAAQVMCPEATPEDLKKGILAATEAKMLVVSKDMGVPLIYRHMAFQAEDQSARWLVRRLSSAKHSMVNIPKGEEPHQWVEQWTAPTGISLTSDQKTAVVRALVEPVSILTGLPGTGKTMTLRIVVKILKDLGEKFALMAPTGIAAKRMEILTGSPATTIHRAFQASRVGRVDNERDSDYAGIVGSSVGVEWDDVDQDWSRMSDVRLIIVDECSMMDQVLLWKILENTPDTCRLMFVGDAAQLPSVGPGQVLHEMIRSGAFPVTDLKDIFRQKQTSPIVFASHAIHRGVDPIPGGDFDFRPIASEADVVSAIEEEAVRLFERAESFQVLSPRHNGDVGVTELNRRLRMKINPATTSSREAKIGGETIREGDRVMVCKNNYRLSIYNGDIGKVVAIQYVADKSTTVIEVKIFGAVPTYVTLTLEEARTLLRLAYAMTVHKSQGQEYENILMPWTMSMGRQLQRTLLYTAITRAKRRVVIFGHWEAVQRAVTNAEQASRNTFLAKRISGYMGSL